MHFDSRSPANVALVVRAALGDMGVLDRLLRLVQQPLFDHIAFILGDTDAASDVLQNVLITISRSLIRLRDPGLFRAWVFRIATRAAIRAQRRSKHRRSLPLDAMPDLPVEEAEDSAFDPELLTSLPTLVGELPHACGVVVRLRYLEQLSVLEVAEALDIPVGTVKSRASYGIELLRRRLSAAAR